MSTLKVSYNLWRGSRPTSAEEIQMFKTIINLEVGFFDFFHGLWRREQYWCEGADVEWKCYTMSDWSRPRVEFLRAVVARIVEARQKGLVLVHCAKGVDRTGIVIASYRIIVEKWPVAQATREMMDLGFHEFPYFYWKPVLESL